MSDITTILAKIDQGDPSASEQLLPLVYDELRSLAAARMARENPGQTLQATALVHEAYLRLVKNDDEVAWDSRGHFFASAAEAMRRILIDRARQKQRPKYGGDRNKLDLEIHCPASDETPDRLLAINEALAKLEREKPEIAELVKLRYFAGVPLKDAAPLLGVSLATAKRRWAFARAFLYEELAD
ncbi:sigma-70 family RNA polymerase sigma factor [Stieleria sp. ICT_E10.1]|uniref:sigma-70 family RNA polymerase sigma factor n=1 Tax=Stieleria sedimenti TaxID=2976331 RepID=UPI0021807ADD|nr:sigma-70 family RNA polymerase sigma factor [Stieleria sedimenti]MCS7469966.1 sigma-70 family RNA polymerase sigma factor [Stieleria sedimenti]